jgi:hypothetical protein
VLLFRDRTDGRTAAVAGEREGLLSFGRHSLLPLSS